MWPIGVAAAASCREFRAAAARLRAVQPVPGTLFDAPPHLPLRGLSPRARGNQRSDRAPRGAQGPIPACAGEPRSGPTRARRPRAYPRVRGGTAYRGVLVEEVGGLSPRARGNPGGAVGTCQDAGPIPACAGEPALDLFLPNLKGAYPRVRGGTRAWFWNPTSALGLSPRARGNLGRMRWRALWLGPIPACAGEPNTEKCIKTILGAYPRVRGGTDSKAVLQVWHEGLSPRARGNLDDLRPVSRVIGPIPACAGEPPGSLRHPIAAGAYPRVRGGTCVATPATSPCVGLSPRARGNLGVQEGPLQCKGPIPACAGEPQGG
jgi:hypothetical protein